jgi:hypothetical protein
MILSYIQDGCHAMTFVWLKNRKSLKILYDLSIVTVSHVGLLTGSLDTILKVDSLSKEDSS